MGSILSRFRWKRSDSVSGVAVEKSEPIQVKTVDPPVTKATDVPRYPPAEQKKEEPLRSKSEASLPKETVPQKPVTQQRNETSYQNIETKPPPVPLTKIAKEEKCPTEFQSEPVKVSTLQIDLQPKPVTQPTTKGAPPQKTEQTPPTSPTHTVKEGVKKIETVKEEITPMGRVVTQETVTTTVTEKQSVDIKKHVVQPQHPTAVTLPTKEEEEEEDEEEEEEDEEMDEDEWETENVSEKRDDKHVEKAVVTIQAGIRGYLTRKALNQQKQEADIQKDGVLQQENATDQEDLDDTLTPINDMTEIVTDNETIKEIAATIVDNVMRLAAEKVPEMVAKQQTGEATQSTTKEILVVQSELPNIRSGKDGKESVERQDTLSSQNSGNTGNIKMEKGLSLDDSPKDKPTELFENDLQQGMDGVMEFDDEDISTEEEAEEENMDVAATKIQASFRGYKVRRELKEKHGVDGPNGERDGLRASGKNSMAHQTVDSDQTSTIKSDGVMKENIATKIASSLQGCDASALDSQHSGDLVQEEKFISDTYTKERVLVDTGSVVTAGPASDSMFGTDNIVFEAITDFGEDSRSVHPFNSQDFFQERLFNSMSNEEKKDALEKFVMQDSLELYPGVSSLNADMSKPKTSDVKEMSQKNSSEDVMKKDQKHVSSTIKEDEEYESSASSSIDEDADVEKDLLNMDSAPWVISPAYHSEMSAPPGAYDNAKDIGKTETSVIFEKNSNPFLNQTVDDNLLLNFNDNTSSVDSSKGSTEPRPNDAIPNYWLLEDTATGTPGQSESLLSFLGDAHPSLDAGNTNLLGQDLMGEDTPVSSQTSIPNKGQESGVKSDEPLKTSNLPENTKKA